MRLVKYIFCIVFALLFFGQAHALHITNYRSPRNNERKVRRRTDYIVLHTTEGAKKGSLGKVYRNGEAHYLIDEGGRVYRIIDKKRVAYHAGRSMWQGLTNLDLYSIGIEVVGYHDRAITASQYEAVKELVKQLQKIYKIPDDRVLTHSMVAYSTPNKWQSEPCRGRKRCAMQFARDHVRLRLGLKKKPMYDPDVKAGRLVIADAYLAKMLYGEKRKVQVKRSQASEVTGASLSTAWELAGDEYNSKTTIYFIPGGTVKRGDELSEAEAETLPNGTTVLTKYVDGGKITKTRSAFDIAGIKWSSASTLYRLPDGTLKPGNEINERSIPTGARIYYKE